MDIILTNINNQIRPLGNLIRIIHPRKPLNLAPPSPFINSLPIRPFTMLKRRSHMNQVKRAILRDLISSGFTTRFKGRDRGRDDSRTSTSKFTGDKGYAGDVLGSVFAGETEFCGELGADGFA